MKLARNFFSKQEQQQIVDAITEAELKTSGEIRVHVESFCFTNEIRRAEQIFLKLNMHLTKEKNGILIYIATVNRKIAVVGDEGIHQKVGNEFWKKMVQEIIAKFHAHRKAEALSECIKECGAQLGTYFPRQADDKDELSNSISY